MSSPHAQHYFFVSSFDQLQTITPILVNSLCQVGETTPPPPTTTSASPPSTSTTASTTATTRTTTSGIQRISGRCQSLLFLFNLLSERIVQKKTSVFSTVCSKNDNTNRLALKSANLYRFAVHIIKRAQAFMYLD